jgi:hypothetical protein
MIHNFEELEVLLNVYNNKIYTIKKAMKYAYLRRDFIKVAELKTEYQLIRKKIVSYIDFYKIKISNNYIEYQIYGNQLKEIEQYYQKYFEDYN